MRWIATISDECVDIMRAKFPTLKEKIIKIENITSERVILKRAEEVADDAYENNDNTLRLLSIGRLVPEKGFDLAVAAAAILKKKELILSGILLVKGRKRKNSNYWRER
jgi:Glycosyl transferases group 1.